MLSVYEKCGSCPQYPIEHEGKCIAKCPEGYFVRDGKCHAIMCPPGYYQY